MSGTEWTAFVLGVGGVVLALCVVAYLHRRDYHFRRDLLERIRRRQIEFLDNGEVRIYEEPEEDESDGTAA